VELSDDATSEDVESVQDGGAPEVPEEDSAVREEPDADGLPDSVEALPVRVSPADGSEPEESAGEEVQTWNWRCLKCDFLISSNQEEVVDQMAKSHARFAHMEADLNQAFQSAQAVSEASDWFVKMVMAGGPDSSDIDAKLVEQYQAAVRYAYLYSKDMGIMFWPREHVPEEFSDILTSEDRWVAVIPPFFFEEDSFEDDGSDPEIVGLHVENSYRRADGTWVITGM
jgi:hypothetical protein